MFNRAKIIDENFLNRVKAGNLPRLPQRATGSTAGIRRIDAVDLFESQMISRHLDLVARDMRARGQGYYTIGSSGHEGNAVFGKVFAVTDMAFLHYRSGAFMVQRAKQLPGSTPIYDQLLSLAASSEDPISSGRHKVFGSVSLNVPPQTSTIASHLPKAVGMALSLRRTHDLGLPGRVPGNSIVLCSFGDASLNHSTAQGALNTAAWTAYQSVPLPLVFICEDNGIGISVKTPDGWVAHGLRQREHLRYFNCNGRDLFDVYRTAVEVERFVRIARKPAVIHMETVRLLGHAGSDVESSYHSMHHITAAEADDPLLYSACRIIENGWMAADEILTLYETIRQRVQRVAEIAVTRPKLSSATEVMASIVPPVRPKIPSQVTDNARREAFGKSWEQLSEPQHMARLINWGLMDNMLRFPNMLIFGEDVAKKGGVYNVTAGLYDRFGPRRVFNTLLDEQAILGNAVGLAHNGLLPVPEIQFLAYVHNAEDQLRGEAATLSFFSNGQYANPMVVRVPGLAYQKGFGGHFHNDNSITVFRDLPGVIVACPSNGRDAVTMMRSCLELAQYEQRICVFIEPIALYMTRDLAREGDGEWSFVYPEPDEVTPLGEIGVYGEGPYVIVTYGNGCYLSLQAQKDLREKEGIETAVIDLRWLLPLPMDKLFEALKDAKAILVVDECRRTGSVSEELITRLVEYGIKVPMRRETATDSFIPIGQASTCTLPSRMSIMHAASRLFKEA